MNSSVLVCLLLTPVFWVLVIKSWRKGFRYLLMYIPFGGLVTLSLYPSPIPTLFPDIFFVIPIYISYFLYQLQSRREKKVPLGFLLIIGALFFLAVLQILNHFLENLLVALIGLKVWFFYIPLVFVTASTIVSKSELISLFRLMVVIAWIPCVIGILIWLAGITFGYIVTLEAIYGPIAKIVSQNFFSFMDGFLFRIPSTFTFVTQYTGFTLAMIVPAYSLMAIESSRKWKMFSASSLVLFSMACLLSGSRGAFIFLPLLLIITLSINGRVFSISKILSILSFMGLIILVFIGFSSVTFNLPNHLLELLIHYGSEVVYKGIVEAIVNAPFGLGTGMNTGASRYAFEDQSFTVFENYYAKSINEFGFLGLILVLGLFLYIIFKGFKILNGVKDPGLKRCAAVLVAFFITMCIHSLKGWQLDLVPINMYYWIFLGSLFSIGSKNFNKHTFVS